MDLPYNYVPPAAGIPTPTREEIIKGPFLTRRTLKLVKSIVNLKVLAAPEGILQKRGRWALPAGELYYAVDGLAFLTQGKRIGPVERVELEIPGARHELVAYRIVADSLVARGHKLPRWAEPSLVVRDTRSLLFHAAGRLVPGDMVWLFAKPERVPHLDRLFASTATAAEADHQFFGDFPLDPMVRMGELEANYGLPVPAAAREVTAAQFMHEALGGYPGIGDRVPLGEVELIVRALSFDDEAITEIGLAAEPTRIDAPRLPFVLGGGDLRLRLTAWLRRRGG